MVIEFNTKKEIDVIALGRACIDLNAVEYNRPMEETFTFKKYVGGSPVNIAIGLARLGKKTGFIGKLSDDQHGRFIQNYLAEKEINIEGVVLDKEGRKTGLAFTEIKSPEECSILMYRENVADLFLEVDEVSEAYIKQAKILLISGTALAQSPSREAAFTALKYAKKNDVTVIFELDYRPYTWQSAEETATYYELVAQQADILIGTRDEFNKMGNAYQTYNEELVEKLFEFDPSLIVIKHGVEGSSAYARNREVVKAKAYKSTVLKTFGAGDSYASAFIYALLEKKSLEETLKYASASAAIVVSRHSSSAAMPTILEIEQLIAEQKQI